MSSQLICPECGGELKWRDDVPILDTLPETYTYECVKCGKRHKVVFNLDVASIFPAKTRKPLD